MKMTVTKLFKSSFDEAKESRRALVVSPPLQAMYDSVKYKNKCMLVYRIVMI